MPENGWVKGKSKNEILSEIVGTAEPGSDVREQQKLGILVRCTEDIEAALKSLERSMSETANSSHELSKKVFWLNIILTIATAIGAIIAVLGLFRPAP
ncbi:MAG: hypothetical protein HY739_00690 [Desulfobacterales bacterium]|nr:hypothetical protein [Desulfobacterales bacterium]